jgi:thioredoxin-like negative regulator of GroEL
VIRAACLAALLVACTRATTPEGPAHANASAWHAEPLDALVARATVARKPLLIDFGASWCAPCRELEERVFPAPDVAAELASFVCARYDVDVEPGKTLGARFGAARLPRLVFLDPDGAPRDALTGLREPAELAAELARIARDEGTLGARRRAIAAQPDALEPRAALARALREFGDRDGYARELAALRARDTAGTSLALRRLLFEEALEPLQRAVDTAALRAFLAAEEHAELLHEGWRTIAAAERMWTQRKRDEHDEAGRREHYELALDAERRAWPHTPMERVIPLGAPLAWEIYERRAELPSETVAFALDVALAVVAASERGATGVDPDLLDTLACLLHANGDAAGALAALRRCIELVPGEPAYRERLREFGG